MLLLQESYSLQQVKEAQRVARKQCLQERAHLRDSKLREKRAAQRAHQAAVQKVQPRVRRDELRQAGEQFAARAKEVVKGKSAEQMAQAPAFIVPASISSVPEQQGGRSSAFDRRLKDALAHASSHSTRQLWTEDGLQDSAKLRASPPQSRSAALGAENKPWRARSLQRAQSDAVSVQIFVPATNAGSPGNSQRQPDCESRNEAPHHPVARACTPPHHLHALRQLTGIAEGDQRPQSPSPEGSSLEGQRAALTDVQAFLDPDVGRPPEAAQCGVDLTAEAGCTHEAGDSGEQNAEASGAAEQAQEGGTGRQAAAGASVTAVKVEELRMKLEAQLGGDTLMAAYQYLQQLDGQEHDKVVQAALEQLLAPNEHLAYSIYKLVTLESLVFSM
jgi:hypothetical protein